MSLSAAKKAVRIQMLKERSCLDEVERVQKGAAAQSIIIGLELFRAARTLALYAPIRQEIDTSVIHHAALAAHKCLCYPRVEQEHLRFFHVKSLAELVVGRFGVLEPAPGSLEIAPARLELLLLPGVAFDRRGFRLGYGRGFYDRFLGASCFTGSKIGFAYDFQLLDCLPVGRHDQPVDLLVTDLAVYSPSAS